MRKSRFTEKKFRQLLQKSLQRGREGGLKNPLPLGYLLKRVHLFSIACEHMTLLNATLRANEDFSSAAFLAVKKIKNDCDVEMENFNETIDYENPENNKIQIS